MLTVPQEFHDYSRASERRTDLIVRLDPLSWPTGINAHGKRVAAFGVDDFPRGCVGVFLLGVQRGIECAQPLGL